MISNGVSCFVAACGLALMASAQHAPKIMPVPGEPLELAAGQVPVAATTDHPACRSKSAGSRAR